MSQMFKNYKNPMTKIGPDNRHEYLPLEKEFWDEIYLGANIQHIFTIPHSIAELADVVIQYYQGTELRVSKDIDELNFKEYGQGKDAYCKASYEISADESLRFNAYNKEVYVQLKAVLEDGDIEYSPKYKILIIDSDLKEV